MTAIKGAKELDAKLKELKGATESKAVRSALRTAIRAALKAARAQVPKGEGPHKTYKGRIVAPGFASRSLRVAVTKPKGGSIRSLLGVRKEAFYALQFIERGTRYIPARPWLVPAFEASVPVMLRTYTEALEKQIKKAARK